MSQYDEDGERYWQDCEQWNAMGRPDLVTCTFCGFKNLMWGARHGDNWLLYDLRGKVHRCQIYVSDVFENLDDFSDLM